MAGAGSAAGTQGVAAALLQGESAAHVAVHGAVLDKQRVLVGAIPVHLDVVVVAVELESAGIEEIRAGTGKRRQREESLHFECDGALLGQRDGRVRERRASAAVGCAGVGIVDSGAVSAEVSCALVDGWDGVSA